MKTKNLWIAFLIFALPAVRSRAQAFQFTQFYAAPTFLNPAFAGAGVCERVTTNYRIQWPSIPGAYKTYLLAFDHEITQKKSGVGILLVNDKAGSGSLRSTGFNAQYSYHLVLSRKWMASAGMEAGLVSRSYDFSKYVFGDQIAYGTSTSVEQPVYEHHMYFDASTGIVAYSEKTWIGFAARHLNEPNQALVSDESRLPILYSVNAGWSMPVKHYGEKGKETTFIKPAFNYRHEKKFDQVDIGMYYTRFDFVMGIWYRGIPLFKAYKPGYQNNDALALLVGVAYKRFKFGYSYDITISRLAGYTGGAHELSISHQFCKKTRKSAIPCPKF